MNVRQTDKGITLTRARTRLGISMRVLTRLIGKSGVEVDMIHPRCALMTQEQFGAVARVFLEEERAKLEESHSRILLLQRIASEMSPEVAV